MTSIRHFLVLFVLFLALPLHAAQEDVTKILDETMDKIWTGSESESTVAQLQKNRDKALSEVGTIGRMWLLHLSSTNTTAPGIVASPSPSPASQPVKQFWPSETKIDQKALPIRVQIALLRGMTGTDPSAIEALEKIGSDVSGADRIRVMDAIARYHFYLRSYPMAKNWVQDGLKEFAAGNAKYPIPEAVRKRLEALRNAIDLAERKDAYGPIWEAGREATVTIDRGNTDLSQAALARAEKLIKEGGATVEPILVQWIAYLRAKEISQRDDATAFLEYSTKINPSTYGPWAVEVLLWRGDALFELGKNAEAASVYDQAVTWLDNRLGKPLPFDPIPKRIAAVATPPADWYRKSHGGGREISVPQAGHLWNADTSQWYVPFFAVEATVKSALVDLISGNNKSALEKIERIKTIDAEDLAQTQKNMPSNYRRFADGFAQGGLFLADYERARVPKNAVNALWLVEVAHELERWDDATILIERFRRRHKGDGSDAIAPALSLQANIMEMDGNVGGADAVLREILKKYPKSISAARAAIRLSQITKKMEEEAIPLLLQVSATFPNTKWSEEADSFRADVLFFNGHQEEGMKLINALIQAASSKDKKDFYMAQKQSFTESLPKGAMK